MTKKSNRISMGRGSMLCIQCEVLLIALHAAKAKRQLSEALLAMEALEQRANEAHAKIRAEIATCEKTTVVK